MRRTVDAIVRDRTSAGLDDTDVAGIDLAELVAPDATALTPERRTRLRELGVSDEEFDPVIFASAARCFLAKWLGGLDADPDASYHDLETSMKASLVLGRPIEPLSD